MFWRRAGPPRSTCSGRWGACARAGIRSRRSRRQRRLMRCWPQAHEILAEDIRVNRAMGEHGAALLADGARVLTHCNAGALATAGHGTALGVIRSAVEAGKRISVIADETRPFLQGARLTAWEMVQEAHPGHAHHRQHGRIPDEPRRGRRGHCRHRSCRRQRRRRQQDRHLHGGGARASPPHPVLRGLPDLHHRHVHCRWRSDSRSRNARREEVTGFRDCQWAADGVLVRNPAFDVTPAELVTALITERGVVHQPNRERLAALAARR